MSVQPNLDTVINCEDTDSALDYLFQRGQYSEPGAAPRPGIVILDLNLPGNGGLEVLTAAKSDPDRRAIPIIVFSSSYDEQEIQNCYRAGANSYIKKPMSSEQFLATIQQIRAYWFKLAILPSTQV